MYSNTPRWTARPHRLFGILRDDPEREIPLVESAYLPIDNARFYIALRSMERAGNRALEAALRDTLERYEANRKAGGHQGPPLRGIRLYELRYRLDRWARNSNRPDGRRLLFEVNEP